MKMIRKGFLVICILLFTVLGCSESKNDSTIAEETAFLATLSTADVNQSLQLSTEGNSKSYSLGSKIDLIINNLSSFSIVMDETTPIKLLTTQDHKWIEVENEITYSGEQVLSPKGTPLLDLGFFPIQTTIEGDKELVLRVVVTGEIMKDNIRTGDLAVAYIDINLTP